MGLITIILWFSRNGFGSGWGDYFEAAGDGTVVMLTAISLFFIPARNGKPGEKILDVSVFKELAWDIIILLGKAWA